MRWGKFTVVTLFLLLFFQGTVYGAVPTALDIYNAIKPLQTGVDLQVAYDLLGPSHEAGKREGESLPFYWYFETGSTATNIPTNAAIVILTRNNSTIHSTAYIEQFKHAESANQRYKDLEKGFNEIFGDAFGGREYAVYWGIEDFRFALHLDYLDEFPPPGQLRTEIIVSYYSRKRE